MPELPEVETVRRGLAPVMEGRRFLRVEQRRRDLRFPFPDRFVDRVQGARLVHLGRRAKFLVGEMDNDLALVMHLGMSGRFTISEHAVGQFKHDPGADPKHDHVVFDMEAGTRVTFNDPRRFGFMELLPLSEIGSSERFRQLGPEPLSNHFSAAHLNRALAGKASPIKSALLDQRVVAGLGNIYVCEALFRAGISPRRSAKTIPGLRANRLAPAVNAVIAEAIEAGGSTLRDFAAADGALGYFQHRFKVYGRAGEPCESCGRQIIRISQSGRSSFFCSTCQR